MRTALNFSELKIQTAQLILALQDAEKLARVRAVLEESSTPKAILEGIDRGLEDSKAGRVTPIEDFLKEVSSL